MAGSVSAYKAPFVIKVKTAETLSIERELKELYGTKISINQKGSKGSIELEFYSHDELNRLIDMLKYKF